MAYRNPIPVVVGIVFITEREVLTVRRAIEPHIGGWALPGGYVEEGDSWRERLRLEIEDEACVLVSEKHMRLYDARTTPDGKRLLIFATIERAGVVEIRDFVPNKEASERKFSALDYYSRPNLCFDLHNDVLEQHSNQHWDHSRQHPGGW